jgi:hypothetical protein
MLRCLLCGRNAGTLNANMVHELCGARQRIGLATPCLGDRCSKCRGMKRLPKSELGPAVFLEGTGPGAIARGIDSWAPKCDHCDGTGVEPGTEGPK